MLRILSFVVLGMAVLVGGASWFMSRASAVPAVVRAAAHSHSTASGPPSSGAAAPSASPVPASTDPTGGSVYRTVGLGDSVPAGTNCPDCTEYVTQVGRAMASSSGKVASVDNEAVAGATTSDVLAQLADASIRARIADADLVIITIGANDLDTSQIDGDCYPLSATGCYRDDLVGISSRLTAIVNRVQGLMSRPGGTIVLTGYWNVIEDGEVGAENGSTYVTASDELTRMFNADVSAVATATSTTYVDVYTPFKGASGTTDDTRLLASDGDHPNAAGHAVLARAIETALGVG